MENKIDLSVIIVTYNSEKYISKLLDSLLRYLPKSSEVIIVDNDSQDSTQEIIKKYKSIKFIESGSNLGYGRGNNLAIKQSKGEYLFLLNPDTVITPNSVQVLLNYAKEHPGVGIVAPKLVQFNNTIQPSVRKLPTLIGALKEYYFKIKNSYEAYVPFGDKPIEVESVVGAAILIRKDFYLKVGGFDEKFFMYFEDLELCRQIGATHKIVYFPEAKILHKVGGSQTVAEKNRKWLYESSIKYHGLLKALLLDIILRLRPK